MNSIPQAPRTFYQKYRPVLFLLLLGGIFFWSLKRQNISIEIFGQLSWPYLLAWGALMGLTWLINSEKLRVLLHTENIYLRGIESFKISAASSVLNYLPLQGGTIVRAMYLQKRHGLPYFNFVTLLGTTYYIMLLCDSFLASALCFLWIHSPSGQYLGSILALGFAVGVVFAVIPLPQFFPKICHRVRAGFVKAIACKRVTIKLFVLEIFSVLVEAIKFWLLIRAFKLDSIPPWPVLWMISAFVFPSVVLNLTPAGIGVREGALAFIAWVSGIEVAHSIIYGGVDRLLTIAWAFALGTPLAYQLFFTDLRAMQQQMVNQNQANH